MKTALIVGVCLLALSLTVTDALDRKQPGCDISAIQPCLNALAAVATNPDAFCDCRDSLIDYYNTCTGGVGADAANQAIAQFCGTDPPPVSTEGSDGSDGTDDTDGGSSAATVGATLFTIVSAVLVVVGN